MPSIAPLQNSPLTERPSTGGATAGDLWPQTDASQISLEFHGDGYGQLVWEFKDVLAIWPDGRQSYVDGELDRLAQKQDTGGIPATGWVAWR